MPSPPPVGPIMAPASTDALPGGPQVRRMGYVRGFEGLRAIALCGVVASHLHVMLPGRDVLVPGGVISLNSFFVLSGFLITALLLKENAATGRISASKFYRRRALRLLPALFVMLAAHTVYAAASNLPADIQMKSVAAAVFYFMNWRLALTGGDNGSTEVTEGLQHIWSLSFEEQIYLLLPIVTIFGLTYTRRLRTVVVVIVGVMVVVGLHRARLYWSGTSWYPIFIRTDTRLDSFLPGVLLAHLWFRGREYHRRIPLGGWIASVVLLACLFLVDIEGPFLYYGGMFVVDIACGLLILAILDGRWRANRLFESRPLVALGRVSYGYYLWHLPVLFAFRRYGEDLEPWVAIPAALALTLVFTLLSWYILEKPSLVWKRELEGRPLDQIAPDAEVAAVVPATPAGQGSPSPAVRAGGRRTGGSAYRSRQTTATTTRWVSTESVPAGGPGMPSSLARRTKEAPRPKPDPRQTVPVAPGASPLARRSKPAPRVVPDGREKAPVGGPGTPSQFTRRASRTPRG